MFIRMKFVLSTAIVATIMALLPNQVESTFMQFVSIDSQTIVMFGERSHRLSTRLLLDGKPYSISGSNTCISGCTNKFCSTDGAICAQVLENCSNNAGFQIYYANTCRLFDLKESSDCDSTIDSPKQSWKGVLINWQDFDFWSGKACLFHQ